MRKLHQLGYIAGMIFLGYTFLRPFLHIILLLVGAFVLFNVIGVIIRVHKALHQNNNSTAGGRKTSTAHREKAYQEETHRQARQEETIKHNVDSLAPHRELFGLSVQYTEAELKSKYRTLAAKYHPDHNSTAGKRKKQNAEDMMKRINEGYAILKKNIETNQL
jgi:hypothetical protein